MRATSEERARRTGARVERSPCTKTIEERRLTRCAVRVSSSRGWLVGCGPELELELLSGLRDQAGTRSGKEGRGKCRITGASSFV